MLDRSFTICASAACAIGAWTVVVLLLVVGTVKDEMFLAMWGVAASAFAATVTIRACLAHYYEVLKNAFDLGREVGVRQLR